MKKLILVGVIGVASTVVSANSPLNIQSGQPAPMGEPVKSQPTKSHAANKLVGDSYASFSAAYSGAKIGADDVGGDSRFSGVDLGLIGAQGDLSAGVGFTYQADSDWKYSEIYSKFGYRLFNQNNNYGIVSTGVGYAWLSAKDYAIDLDYFVLPVELEVGHYFQSNLAMYAALGYKWLWNTSGEACYGNVCASGSSSELDVDGMTYKAGLRYNF